METTQQQAIQTVPDWQRRIDQLNESAWEIRKTNVPEAAKLSQKAYEMAKIQGYDVGEAHSLRTLTSCENSRSNYEKSLLYAFQAVSKFEQIGDKIGLANMYNIMSRVYWEIGDYSETLSYLSNVLALAKETNNHQLEAHALGNSANTYATLKQYEQALTMLETALDLHRQDSNVPNIVTTLNNMAFVYHASGDSESALKTAHESLHLGTQPIQMVAVLDTLGQIYQDIDEHEEALVYLRRSLDISTQHNIKYNKLSILLNIGRIYAKQKDYTQALMYLEQSNQIATSSGVGQMQREIHFALAGVYEELEDFETALGHHRQFHEIHEKIFSNQSDQRIRSLEARYKTESALQEAELYRDKSEELEKEITHRREVELRLVEAKEAAEVANQAKSSFLSSMSHELRTPLNGILGYTQILLRDPTLTNSQVDGIQIVQRSGQHLLTLISDILDISKIEANKLELIPSDVDFSIFVSDVVGLMQMRAQQQKVHFNYEPVTNLPSGVSVDEKRLRQVLINLLGNAIKFTPAKGEVSLKITPLKQDNDDVSLRFEVIDTGVGMKPEDLKKIFRRFEQVGDAKQRSGGTGLGLSISDQLVKAMGGEIEVESTLGVGSRFWFDITLPICTEFDSYSRSNTPMITGYEGERKLVLIVDDQATNRAVSRSLLAPLGFEVEEAINGREAVEKTQTHHPDLILMDLVMPIMDGHDAIASIRADKQLKQPNIIAISAGVLDSVKRKQLLTQCYALLPKPIEADELLRDIERALDLEWVYDENEGSRRYNATTDTFQEFDPNEVTYPPLADLNTLHEHAMMGDFDAIEAIVSSLDQSQYKPFIDRIATLIQSFEDEQIIELIQQGISLSV